MSNEQSSSKRRLLKSLAAGGGAAAAAYALPAKWTRPVVDMALLPAHAQTSVACSLAASMRWNTNQADWDLGISFQGARLTGKGGSIPGLSHGPDATPPGQNSGTVDLRETISGTLQMVGTYRVFARLAAVDGDTSDAESGVRGSITTCSDSFTIAVDIPDTPVNGEFDFAHIIVKPDGTASIV